MILLPDDRVTLCDALVPVLPPKVVAGVPTVETSRYDTEQPVAAVVADKVALTVLAPPGTLAARYRANDPKLLLLLKWISFSSVIVAAPYFGTDMVAVLLSTQNHT